MVRLRLLRCPHLFVEALYDVGIGLMEVRSEVGIGLMEVRSDRPDGGEIR